MSKVSKKFDKDTETYLIPAVTPEERENQMIALAMDLAEKQLRDGTASSQLISHFLKLGSQKEQVAKEKTEKEIELISAKTESYKSTAHIEELYKEAIEAMKSYSYDGVDVLD